MWLANRSGWAGRSLGVLVGKACLGSGRRPGVARHASNFLSRRRKKVTKERATLHAASLRFAAGNLWCSCVGRAAELATRCALRSNNRSESVHEAWALRRPCSPRNRPAAGAASRGAAEQPTSIRAIAALGPVCAARGACARERGPSAAQRSNGPCGCPFRGSLLRVPRSAGQGCVRVPKDTRTSCTDLPQLFERSA